MSSNKNILKLGDILKITSSENNELFSVLNNLSQDIICSYEKDDMKKYLGENIIVRKTIADKLITISKKLVSMYPYYKLKIVYGYRHPDVQKKYFEQMKFELKKKYPNNSEEELNMKTHMFVADPRVAGHPTGGAVDITITTPDGDLNMGTKIADFSDKEKIRTFSTSINEEQNNNRKLLYNLMISEEFAPFHGEWWHFSYGDMEWAFFYEKNSSLYSKINYNL